MSQSPLVSDLVARLLSAKTQASMVALLRMEDRPPATKALSAEVKAHVSVLAEHLTEGRAREAIATALAMIFLDPDHAISCMRRDGVLRASRYGYKGSLIGRIAKTVLNVRDLLIASPDRIAYLESVEALSRLAGNALQLKLEVEAKVRAHRSVVLKTVFVMVTAYSIKGGSTTRKPVRWMAGVTRLRSTPRLPRLYCIPTRQCSQSTALPSAMSTPRRSGRTR